MKSSGHCRQSGFGALLPWLAACNSPRYCNCMGGEPALEAIAPGLMVRPLQVWSSVAAPGALVLHDAMPLSRDEADAYISLLPMTWPLPALSEKYGDPFLATRRSKRPSSAAFFSPTRYR